MNPPSELKSAFRPRPAESNKYTVGTVTVVGGSGRYISAPVIAALGARAAGAGLVHLVVPDASRLGAATLVPEATFTKLSATCVPPKADVTVIGMGLGKSVAAEVIVTRLLSGSPGRFVLDADGLAILAGWYGKLGGYDPAAGQELVLTPHEGEAANLLGTRREEVARDRAAAAREIASRYGATVVLKGQRTLVVAADGAASYENRAGNPFMALGGMGDLLAGAIGARWAYLKADAFLSASSAVWLHSAASDRLVAAKRDPSIFNTASEIGSLRVDLDA
ncbi:MAG: NAD(P)H-hydrate dehydratase [Kiritimatiellae bacterium]|nr:NAD(P)H-hydrate dehydratase [Kiritimatiellia bacterium]MBQ6925859.1 NAD(P)H-hydrate dehydratase [Kiritimatiellia bacterium]